jgi:Ca2+-binding RTX toxin-like protein
VLRGESGNDRLTIDVDPGMTTGTIHDRSILDGGSSTDTLVFNTALPVTMYAGDPMIFGETGPFDWDNAILLGGPVNTPAGDPKAYADFSGIERFDFSGSTGRLTYISLDPAADLTVIGTNSATGDEFQDGDGDEQLFGLAGNDVLALWGGGNDVLDGGAGDDTFQFKFSQTSFRIMNWAGRGEMDPIGETIGVAG